MKKKLNLFHQLVKLLVVLLLFQLAAFTSLHAQVRTKLSLTVSVADPSAHLYHVQLKYKPSKKHVLRFRMCRWTPGFYEIENYGSLVSNFKVTDRSGKILNWTKSADSTWDVHVDKLSALTLSYDVTAENPFIANANLDTNYGYFVPGAVCMYLDEALKQPLMIEIRPYNYWPSTVATGLDPIAGKINTYFVKNFDILFDSPFLMGNLERFPTKLINRKKVQFIGYQMGHFDRKLFMDNLSRIAQSANAIIGDVPYNHYTFLGVGMPIRGFGGIEHLNSASLIMAKDSALIAQPAMQEAMYAFLAHEYFHLYNVKRIRPIALGPFDYTKENFTNMLWVSEGFTDYYEYLILNRAGMMARERVLANYQEHIRNYENSPGHLYQSLIQSSRGIWAQRGKPQERTPEEMAKTISVYDKGCIMGMMIDLKIRFETQNRKSLDNVMRNLYRKFYQAKHRGFTDIEFQRECEAVAGIPLSELFSYAATTSTVNYPKYLSYAGLSIDTVKRALPNLSIGADVKFNSLDTSLIVRNVSWPSSAFTAGLKAGDKIKWINGFRVSQQFFDSLMLSNHSGDQLRISVESGKIIKDLEVTLTTKYERSFEIKPVPHPSSLQIAIYKSWLR